MEQRLGKDTLLATQASLLKATGDIAISDDSQQHLLMSVSFFFLYFRERSRECLSFMILLTYPGTLPELKVPIL